MSDCYRIVLGSNSLSSIRSNPHRAYRGFGHQETQIKTLRYNKIPITIVQLIKVMVFRTQKKFSEILIREFLGFLFKNSQFQNVEIVF